jgi:hypothetical protein
MGGNKKGRGRDLLFYFKQEAKIRQPRRRAGTLRPGKAYIVGEEHSFIPGKTGSVAPVLRTEATGGHTFNLHLHGVSDADSFKRTHGRIGNQEMNWLSRSADRR